MKKPYKITIHTRDIFNFATSMVIKQYEPNPVILGYYDSDEGQLVDLKIHCSMNEKLIITVALSDYILRMVQIDNDGKELGLWERLISTLI